MQPSDQNSEPPTRKVRCVSLDRPSTESRRYSSPPPSKSRFTDGKSLYSPPPPPLHFAVREVGGEPAAESMLLELNSGRSIFNPTEKSLEKIFEFEDPHRRRVMSGGDIQPLPPSCLNFLPSVLGGGGASEEEDYDDDMPPTARNAIRLPVRLSRPRPRSHLVPTTRRRTGTSTQHSFVPIQHNGDSDDESYCEL